MVLIFLLVLGIVLKMYSVAFSCFQIKRRVTNHKYLSCRGSRKITFPSTVFTFCTWMHYLFFLFSVHIVLFSTFMYILLISQSLCTSNTFGKYNC